LKLIKLNHTLFLLRYILKYQARGNLIQNSREFNSTQLKLGLSLDEEECKNSMQSSTVSARCESVRSDTDRDLTKVDEEETFLEDLLFIETLLIELATFVPSCTRYFKGDDNLDCSLVNLKLPLSISLFLRKIVGMSLTLGLKHTLLLLMDILKNYRRILIWKKKCCFSFCVWFVKGKRSRIWKGEIGLKRESWNVC